MKITFWKGVFVADSPPTDGTELRRAGFKLHEPTICNLDGKPCKGCRANIGRRWWTSQVEAATKLHSHCNDRALSVMKDHLRKLAASRALDVAIDIPAPPGLSYLPFQKAGIAYALDRKDTLVADEPGCVDGEAIIRVNRGGRGFACKIKDAYQRFRGLDRANWNWDPKIPTYVRSLCDGELRLNKLTNILDRGERQVLEIKLASRKKLKLTHDHEVALEGGAWKATLDLRPGNKVLTNGRLACNICHSTTKKIVTYKYARFRGSCRHCMYRTLRAKPTWKGGKFIDEDGYVRISGQFNHPRTHHGAMYEHVLVMEKKLGRHIDWPRKHAHHKNGIKSDNRPENLELVSPSEHLREHRGHLHMNGGRGGRGGLIKFIPSVSQVVSIRPAGKAHVFDLVMTDPHRNFVANGIVVHNCGKTIQALGFINKVTPKNVLVVCPLTLSWNWKNEAEKWLVDPYQIVIPKSRSSEIPTRDGLFVITNYEKIIGDTPLKKSLERIWDTLILDEAHALKNAATERSEAVLGEFGLMRRSHRCLFLTGTPIENYPKEIWPIAAACCPAKFGSWWAFATRYCGLHKENHNGRDVWVATGSSNLSELQQRLRSTFMVRRLRKDVLKELPPKRRQLIVLGQGDPKWKEHPQFKKWMETYEKKHEAAMAALEAAATEIEYKKAAKSLEELTGIAFTEMSEFRHVSALAKLPLCLKYIDEALESGLPKIVIFAHHVDVLEKIKAHFGNDAVLVHGGTPQIERERAVKTFQTGSTRIFIGGFRAAGQGITLTAADTVIFVETDWVPGVLSQAEDRCVRIGQKKMVHIIHLVLDGTLDANMTRRVMKKQEIIEKALDRKEEHRARSTESGAQNTTMKKTRQLSLSPE